MDWLRDYDVLVVVSGGSSLHLDNLAFVAERELTVSFNSAAVVDRSVRTKRGRRSSADAVAVIIFKYTKASTTPPQ